MKIEMNDIESHIARTDDTHNGIQVGSVIVAESAAVMDDLGDLADVLVKQPYCVRVGEHQSCDIIAGSYKAENGRLYLSESGSSFTAEESVGYTLSGSTMTWNDDNALLADLEDMGISSSLKWEKQ